MSMKCPGQDRARWKPEDVSDTPCPACGARVEVFKDEGARRCPGCGVMVQNLNLDLGCAEWCRHAEKCLGITPKERKGAI